MRSPFPIISDKVRYETALVLAFLCGVCAPRICYGEGKKNSVVITERNPAVISEAAAKLPQIIAILNTETINRNLDEHYKKFSSAAPEEKDYAKQQLITYIETEARPAVNNILAKIRNLAENNEPPTQDAVAKAMELRKKIENILSEIFKTQIGNSATLGGINKLSLKLRLDIGNAGILNGFYNGEGSDAISISRLGKPPALNLNYSAWKSEINHILRPVKIKDLRLPPIAAFNLSLKSLIKNGVMQAYRYYQTESIISAAKWLLGRRDYLIKQYSAKPNKKTFSEIERLTALIDNKNALGKSWEVEVYETVKNSAQMKTIREYERRIAHISGNKTNAKKLAELKKSYEAFKKRNKLFLSFTQVFDKKRELNKTLLHNGSLPNGFSLLAGELPDAFIYEYQLSPKDEISAVKIAVPPSRKDLMFYNYPKSDIAGKTSAGFAMRIDGTDYIQSLDGIFSGKVEKKDGAVFTEIKNNNTGISYQQTCYKSGKTLRETIFFLKRNGKETPVRIDSESRNGEKFSADIRLGTFKQTAPDGTIRYGRIDKNGKQKFESIAKDGLITYIRGNRTQTFYTDKNTGKTASFLRIDLSRKNIETGFAGLKQTIKSSFGLIRPDYSEKEIAGMAHFLRDLKEHSNGDLKITGIKGTTTRKLNSFLMTHLPERELKDALAEKSGRYDVFYAKIGERHGENIYMGAHIAKTGETELFKQVGEEGERISLGTYSGQDKFEKTSGISEQPSLLSILFHNPTTVMKKQKDVYSVSEDGEKKFIKSEPAKDEIIFEHPGLLSEMGSGYGKVLGSVGHLTASAAFTAIGLPVKAVSFALKMPELFGGNEILPEVGYFADEYLSYAQDNFLHNPASKEVRNALNGMDIGTGVEIESSGRELPNIGNKIREHKGMGVIAAVGGGCGFVVSQFGPILQAGYLVQKFAAYPDLMALKNTTRIGTALYFLGQNGEGFIDMGVETAKLLAGKINTPQEEARFNSSLERFIKESIFFGAIGYRNIRMFIVNAKNYRIAAKNIERAEIGLGSLPYASEYESPFAKYLTNPWFWGKEISVGTKLPLFKPVTGIETLKNKIATNSVGKLWNKFISMPLMKKLTIAFDPRLTGANVQ